MSETPRTDEAQFGTGRVSVYFARILELKLNAANDRIKRLEEALRRIANTDYRGNRSTESQIAEEALKP